MRESEDGRTEWMEMLRKKKHKNNKILVQVKKKACETWCFSTRKKEKKRSLANPAQTILTHTNCFWRVLTTDKKDPKSVWERGGKHFSILDAFNFKWIN